MFSRISLLLILIAAAGGSFWLLNQVLDDGSDTQQLSFNDPDYYLEDFTTTSMNQDGTPKNKLYAVYMAHYPDDDTSELLQPEMELYREAKLPVYIKADKGWVTADNDVIFLSGNVQMWENDEYGVRILQVDTDEVKVLINDDYAETDQYATIVSKRSTITGTGMRAYLDESRLVVLDHEKTRIDQPSI